MVIFNVYSRITTDDAHKIIENIYENSLNWLIFNDFCVYIKILSNFSYINNCQFFIILIKMSTYYIIF